MFGRLATYFLERRKLRTSRHALHRYALQDTKTNAHASKNGTGNYETTSENQKTKKKRRRAGYGGTKMATVGRTRTRRVTESHLPTTKLILDSKPLAACSLQTSNEKDILSILPNNSSMLDFRPLAWQVQRTPLGCLAQTVPSEMNTCMHFIRSHA